MDHLEVTSDTASARGSRATSPGYAWREVDNAKALDVNSRKSTDGSPQDEAVQQEQHSQTSRPSRYRPRTFPYQRYLPYKHDDRSMQNLDYYIKNLYIAISAGDFVPGATHWTREIRGWMQLKFDLPRSDRVKLGKLYYELTLAPGVEEGASDRFLSMFITLTKRKHYLRAADGLKLDWRPLFRELKATALPSDTTSVVNVGSPTSRKSARALVKISSNAQLYFDSSEIPHIYEEVLPYFNTSSAENAFSVISILNLILPSTPPPADSEWQPQHHFPTLFHLWSIMNRSKICDLNFLDIFSRFARDSLTSGHVPFSEYGIFTGEQTSMIFTAVLRLLEIPVSQVSSVYSTSVDLNQGLSLIIDRDRRKNPVTHHIARWIVMSLSPAAAASPDSMLSKLEGLIQAVETFFHPSNTGSWTKSLSQLVFHLTEAFMMRWNRERSGELDVPPERRLDEAVKRRFILCLRDVTFMGIFAKSKTAMSHSLTSMSWMAFLEPDLILPGALQRIYPSMRGSVEVHRTTSSIQALHELTRTMIKQKGFRCHVTSLLGLALPGIDANDLDKTMHTLSFFQDVFYLIPMHDLTATHSDSEEKLDSSLAAHWVSSQIERFENEGIDVEVDYERELSDIDEVAILRSSTADFKTFLSSFLERVFNLLRNLPDAAKVKSGTPEEGITNSLPATFTPMFAAMSPDLYDMALHKIADFVSQQTTFQAKDAMSFICGCMCKVNPEKTLEVLVPILCRNIRSEIDDNLAGSTRTTGAEVLNRDKALVWNISLLSMSCVHVGSALLNFGPQLLDIIKYMLQKCRGIPATHASNLLHHILLTMTMTYTVDCGLYEAEDVQNGVTAAQWGYIPDPQRLNIKWHYPDQKELDFAIDLFKTFTEKETERLRQLISDNPPIKRDGTAKEWSDEVSRSLVLVRLLISGASALFDPRNDIATSGSPDTREDSDSDAGSQNADEMEGVEAQEYNATEDEDVKPTFQYPVGNQLTPGTANYELVHRLRVDIGRTLNEVHAFLVSRQQDDVTAFSSLYQAYRSFFTDVGIERSAHVLDRVTRLLVADSGPFKYSGLRKEYPRPLLVRRANVYHLQRLRHNSSPRYRNELDAQLLHNLVQSSVSLYTEIRKTAQTAIESTMKVLIGARRVVIPLFLEHFETAIAANDFPRIKGAMFSLLFSSLTRPVGRDWKFAPSLIRSFINVMDVDKPSIQKIAAGATVQVLDMSVQSSRMAILDQFPVDNLVGSDVHGDSRISAKITKRKRVIRNRFEFITDRRIKLSNELADVAQKSHWKKEGRTAALVIGLSLRFDDVTSLEIVDLIVKRTVDSHPSLRSIYSRGLLGLFVYLDMRAAAGHSYENLLMDKKEVPSFVKLLPELDNPTFTQQHLQAFSQPRAEAYVDLDFPGWLVWGKDIPAFRAAMSSMPQYDEVEQKIRVRVGALLDRKWFATLFDYMKQEPRDSGHDRFRVGNLVILTGSFNLMLAGLTVATFNDIKELISNVFEGGTDKHQHRATAEILASLINSALALAPAQREEIWSYAFPIVRDIFEDGITPENSQYWVAFLDVVTQNKDPRRVWPLIEWLASFRLDMTSNAAFKESSKITLLNHAIMIFGWHFQLDKPIAEDFINHLDHPYKGVREVMGTTLAFLFRSRYHESYRDIISLVEHQKQSSSLGSRPYQIDQASTQSITDIFQRIEKWRKERPPGQQTASSYTSGSKTLLAWLASSLFSFECTQFIPFIPDLFLEAFLHMMDIKEDPELQSHAYSVFRLLGNVPFRAGEEKDFIQAMMRIGRNATSWHQRLRIMINIQALYFRHLFLMPLSRQMELFDCISEMLKDSQLEVRVGAGTTLSGMIRCSPIALRKTVIDKLTKSFTKALKDNPLPKRTGGTPTPEHNRITIVRHAAVLGLGALVQAFPYTSPPPAWMPAVLATLATRAAGDPGTIGKSAKGIVADFKKTRQDTWHIDVKAFEPEQLEDLEGVLWKSYFA